MAVQVVQMPPRNVQDIPRGLRTLADQAESGQLGDCHCICYAIDCGDGRVEVGMLGPSAEPGPTAHLIFAKAMRMLEEG